MERANGKATHVLKETDDAWVNIYTDELIKAGKMFDMMIYPIRQHGIEDAPASIHLFKTMIEFWTKNL